MGRVSVGDAGDERAQADTVRAGGEVGQRRVALEEVFPGSTDLRDLTEMIHHVHRVKTCRLGERRNLTERRPSGRRTAGERVGTEVEAET